MELQYLCDRAPRLLRVDPSETGSSHSAGTRDRTRGWIFGGLGAGLPAKEFETVR